MANNVIDWVLSFTNIPPIEKFVGVIVGDDANKVGTSQYLGSVRRIGSLAGVSERRARQALRWWENSGLMDIYADFRTNGSNTVNRYQLHTTIDPKTWVLPAELKGRKVQSRMDIMSTFDRAAFLTILSSKFDPQAIATWIHPTKIVGVEKNRLILTPPTPLFATYLHDHTPQLLEAARQVAPTITKLHILLKGK